MKPSSFEMNAVKKHESPHMKVKDTNTTLVNSAEKNKTPENADVASPNEKGASSSDTTSAGISSQSNLKQSSNDTSSIHDATLSSVEKNTDKTNSSSSVNASIKPLGNTKKCEWDGKYISNHTLVGGINSGDFKEHAKAITIEQCMDNCCKEEDCDLSFMIDTDCYTVKCSRSDLCQTRKAKTTTFKPKIAYKRRSNMVVDDERK